jgi:phage terminase small subunit
MNKPLSRRKARFVKEYCNIGGRNGAEAARRAGYPESNAKQQAYLLLRDEKVLAEIKREVESRFRAGAAIALEALEDMARGGPPAQRVQAANAILEHAGFLISKHVRHEHEHTHRLATLSDEELSAHIQRLQKEVGGKGQVIDAEFQEVEPAKLAAPEEDPLSADLARLAEEMEADGNA